MHVTVIIPFMTGIVTVIGPFLIVHERSKNGHGNGRRYDNIMDMNGNGERSKMVMNKRSQSRAFNFSMHICIEIVKAITVLYFIKFDAFSISRGRLMLILA
jgi:hypothetical protein